MKAEELIKRARYELHDTNALEYKDEELLHYLADAVSLLSRLLIESRSTHSIRETWVTVSPNPLPEKFVALVDYDPARVRINNNDLYCKRLPHRLRYYIEYTRPDRPGFIMDVPEAFEPLLSQMVTARALNRNEYNTALEQQYLQMYRAEVVKIGRQRDGLVTGKDRKLKYDV